MVNYRVLATPRPIEVIEPCNPSPCGRNAECTERGQAASCRCILDYVGNPYVECKPECTVNSECPRDKACLNNKCGDPCPGVCGAHASCAVNNHNPVCTCDPGFTGNAFFSCSRITTRKFLSSKLRQHNNHFLPAPPRLLPLALPRLLPLALALALALPGLGLPAQNLYKPKRIFEFVKVY